MVGFSRQYRLIMFYKFKIIPRQHADCVTFFSLGRRCHFTITDWKCTHRKRHQSLDSAFLNLAIKNVPRFSSAPPHLIGNDTSHAYLNQTPSCYTLIRNATQDPAVSWQYRKSEEMQLLRPLLLYYNLLNNPKDMSSLKNKTSGSTHKANNAGKNTPNSGKNTTTTNPKSGGGGVFQNPVIRFRWTCGESTLCIRLQYLRERRIKKHAFNPNNMVLVHLCFVCALYTTNPILLTVTYSLYCTCFQYNPGCDTQIYYYSGPYRCRRMMGQQASNLPSKSHNSVWRHWPQHNDTRAWYR